MKRCRALQEAMFELMPKQISLRGPPYSFFFSFQFFSGFSGFAYFLRPFYMFFVVFEAVLNVFWFVEAVLVFFVFFWGRFTIFRSQFRTWQNRVQPCFELFSSFTCLFAFCCRIAFETRLAVFVVKLRSGQQIYIYYLLLFHNSESPGRGLKTYSM